jgi:hypothetical protein
MRCPLASVDAVVRRLLPSSQLAVWSNCTRVGETTDMLRSRGPVHRTAGRSHRHSVRVSELASPGTGATAGERARLDGQLYQRTRLLGVAMCSPLRGPLITALPRAGCCAQVWGVRRRRGKQHVRMPSIARRPLASQPRGPFIPMHSGDVCSGRAVVSRRAPATISAPPA